LSEPRIILAVGALCGETEEEAQRLISSARVFRRRIRRGELGPIPTTEEALRELGNSPVQAESAEVLARSFGIGQGGLSQGGEDTDQSDRSEFPRYVVGAPDRVRDRLLDMASVLGADELMIVTVMHGHRERVHSYKLLADAFGLKPR
jgi:alkanesulfonate monooxygenase SsuD/methylene tetrahydromethanopterin reductase-like flavin-dependent oxidoreductase (luciferase family)